MIHNPPQVNAIIEVSIEKKFIMILKIPDWLLRNVTCDQCKCAYGVDTFALFCPNCGAANLSLHFGYEKKLIREQIELADQVEEQGKEEQGKRELAYRLLGNAYEDAVTAFEAYQKAVAKFLYDKLPKRGTFQNINNLKKFWKEN